MSRIPTDVNVASSKPQKYVMATALAKRDTNPITIDVTVDGLKSKRLIIRTSLDQALNVTASITFDNGGTWLGVGTTKSVAANAGVIISTETDSNLQALNLLEGKVRVAITPVAAPTAGILDAIFQTNVF